jgi:anti-sigma regulatory factor (Ser/Thr protein kinase)
LEPVGVITPADDFVHTGYCHHSTEELVEALASFVVDGLSGGCPVFVNLAPDRIAALRAALGADGRRVRWSDTTRWEPHPARRLRALQDLVAEATVAGGPRLQFVGECAWPDGPPELLAEWERFDSVLNHGLAGMPVTMVCAYDASSLPAGILGHVAEMHPLTGVRPVRSHAYVAPEAWLAAHAPPPSAVPDGARETEGRSGTSTARQFVRATFAGVLSESAVDDLAIAVTEVLSNALRMSSGPVRVRSWTTDAEAVVQVDDDGPGLGDPLAGYRRPPTGAEAGRGLWIARQLADLVHIVAGSGGTSVQIRMFLEPRTPAGVS